MSTEKLGGGSHIVQPDSAVASVGGLNPALSRSPVTDSALVSVSVATRLSQVATVVSSMVKVGVSTTVRLRSGNKEGLRSAIASLNDKAEVVSATLTLRGLHPVK